MITVERDADELPGLGDSAMMKSRKGLVFMEEVIVVNNRAAMAMVDVHFDSSCGMSVE